MNVVRCQSSRRSSQIRLSRTLHSLFAVMVCTAFLGCDTKKAESPSPNAATTEGVSAPRAATMKSSAEIARTLSSVTLDALTTCVEHAKTLQNKIERLIEEPTPGHLKAAQDTWINGALSYRSAMLQKHISLVDPNVFARINRLDYQIAFYPIQPGFIDEFGPYKYSGLVHDIGFPITRESLENQHGLTDLGDVILGFYAIEFLLFNVDGQRDLGDFVAIDTLGEELQQRGFENLEEVPNNRRRALLSLQASILVSNLEELVDQWQLAQGVPVKISGLSQQEAERLVHSALASAITQLLLELSGFTSENNESVVSTQIVQAGLNTQKIFTHNAIQSLTVINDLLLNKNKADYDRAALLAAAKLTQDSATESIDDVNAYWASVFEQLKQVSDSLLL